MLACLAVDCRLPSPASTCSWTGTADTLKQCHAKAGARLFSNRLPAAAPSQHLQRTTQHESKGWCCIKAGAALCARPVCTGLADQHNICGRQAASCLGSRAPLGRETLLGRKTFLGRRHSLAGLAHLGPATAASARPRLHEWHGVFAAMSAMHWIGSYSTRGSSGGGRRWHCTSSANNCSRRGSSGGGSGSGSRYTSGAGCPTAGEACALLFAPPNESSSRCSCLLQQQSSSSKPIPPSPTCVVVHAQWLFARRLQRRNLVCLPLCRRVEVEAQEAGVAALQVESSRARQAATGSECRLQSGVRQAAKGSECRLQGGVGAGSYRH